MRGGLLGFCLGVGATALLPAVPAPPVQAVLLGLALGLRRWPLGLGFGLGLAWASFWGYTLLEQHLPPDVVGQDVILVGYIADFPTVAPRNQRFEFVVTHWQGQPRPANRPARLRLTWYEMPSLPLQAGARWQFTVRLKPPHSTQNPGSFDYETWLFAQRIRAVGYVRAHPAPQALAGAAAPVLQARQALRTALLATLTPTTGPLPPGVGLLLALGLGDASLITPQQWELFRLTGTTHLVSVSGLHITLLAGLAYGLLRGLWPLLPGLALRLPAQQAGAGAGLLVAVLYAVLAGMSLPTQRALVMGAVVFGAWLLRRQTRTLDTLLLALAAVLLFDPLAVLNGGFWLSFLSVAALLYAFNAGARSGWVRQWLLAQLVANLALLVPLLWLFQQVSLVSPLANLIAIPWVSWVVTPLAVLGLLLLPLWSAGAEAVLHLGLLAWAPQESLLAGLAAWPWATVVLPQPPVVYVLLAVPGVLWLLAPRPVPRRWLGLVLLLPALAWQPPRPAPGEFWFTLLDVGQGLAAVIQTARHTLVYDTGARWGPDSAQALRVVVPYLQTQGVRHLDRLVLSHSDNDHSGGAGALVQALPTWHISTSDPAAFPALRTALCQRGQHWRWDGVELRFLHPPAGWSGNDNERSCVLQVSVGQQQVLLVGDIERQAEAALVQTEAARLPSTVLVAPHHGSRSSSGTAFVAATRPRYVLYASGYLNRYRFPHPEVVARYAAGGAVALSSPDSGAIQLRFSPEGLGAPLRYRCGHRRYWHLLAESCTASAQPGSAQIGSVVQVAYN